MLRPDILPLSDQLKQLVELHKAAEQAMKGLIVRLWWTVASLPRFMKRRPSIHVCSEILGCAGHSGLSKQPFSFMFTTDQPSSFFFFLKMASPVFFVI